MRLAASLTASADFLLHGTLRKRSSFSSPLHIRPIDGRICIPGLTSLPSDPAHVPLQAHGRFADDLPFMGKDLAGAARHDSAEGAEGDSLNIVNQDVATAAVRQARGTASECRPNTLPQTSIQMQATASCMPADLALRPVKLAVFLPPCAPCPSSTARLIMAVWLHHGDETGAK